MENKKPENKKPRVRYTNRTKRYPEKMKGYPRYRSTTLKDAWEAIKDALFY